MINKLVAAFLSDPECEGQNVFAANPSGQGRVEYARLDFNALINSNCLAIERHNIFNALSGIPSIGNPWANYCDCKRKGLPVNQDRKNLLNAIKNWRGSGSIVNISDICHTIAAKFRLRLENAKRDGAISGAGKFCIFIYKSDEILHIINFVL